MSFECKFYDKGYCVQLKKTCKPGQSGCVLFGRVKFISPLQSQQTESPDSSPLPSNDTEPHPRH